MGVPIETCWGGEIWNDEMNGGKSNIL
jgi:hypothetical protein